MKLGITGGIGSGKSHVARLLTGTFGIPVYDCDSQARRLMTISADIRQHLTSLVGEDAYRPDGRLNSPVLATFLFACDQNAAAVNAIVHPVVKTDFLQWAAEQKTDHVALESAILFEAGFENIVDRVLLVEAPSELRIHRVMLRDHTDVQQVRQRMARQLSDDDRRLLKADVVFNDGRDLMPQLKNIIHSLIKD